MRCREATRVVSEALDRRPPFWRRLRLRLHLFICPNCARFRRQLVFLIEAVSDYAAGRAPGLPEHLRLSPEARDRLKRSLRGEHS